MRQRPHTNEIHAIYRRHVCPGLGCHRPPELLITAGKARHPSKSISKCAASLVRNCGCNSSSHFKAEYQLLEIRTSIAECGASGVSVARLEGWGNRCPRDLRSGRGRE